MTTEEGINQVFGRGGHVVILGAGASIASTSRNPEKGGKALPSMDNFIDVVDLSDILKSVPQEFKAQNFETLYGNLHRVNPESEEIAEIEKRVRSYFESMKLPDQPTIYDYLILSLRDRDLIATFNWEPFLFHAWNRNRKLTDNLPCISFLHGSVSIGYSDKIKRGGPSGAYLPDKEVYFEPTRLLYPVEQKNYTNDDFISMEWERVKYWLSKESGTVRATVLGYGAPASDVEAVSLLSNAWGNNSDRDMEQFEVIDIAEEEELRTRWSKFIFSHHYNIVRDYFQSSLALNPRRTSESYFSHYQPMSSSEAFRKNNPVPTNFRTLEELWEWHEPLIEAEKRAGVMYRGQES